MSLRFDFAYDTRCNLSDATILPELCSPNGERFVNGDAGWRFPCRDLLVGGCLVATAGGTPSMTAPGSTTTKATVY